MDQSSFKQRIKEHSKNELLKNIFKAKSSNNASCMDKLENKIQLDNYNKFKGTISDKKCKKIDSKGQIRKNRVKFNYINLKTRTKNISEVKL